MPDISQFDPNAFLDATIDEPTVKRPPLPIGDYLATIGQIEARTWQSKDGTKSGIAWDVPLTLEIPAEIQTELGFDQSTLTIKDSIMLDLTSQGAIDNGPGKNRRLRQYREATDLNKPGDSFSARKMEGKIITAKLKHDEWQGDLYEKVQAVARS